MCDIDWAMKKPEAGPALEAASRGLSRKEAGSLGRGNEVKVKRPPPNAVSPYRDGCRICSCSMNYMLVNLITHLVVELQMM